MSVYFKEHPGFLKVAIKSMLKQTVAPDEFVLVEDGPLTLGLNAVIDDFVKEKPELFRIVRIKNNVGLGPALRRGVKECSYELIARMDSDDYAKPKRVEKQLRFLANHPNLDIIGSNVEEFAGDIKNVISHVILPETQEEIYNFSKTRCPFRHPSLLYKKSAVLKAKNYRQFYLCEDYDLYIRMLRSGAQCYNIQEPLTYMRVSPDFYKRRGGWKYMRTILTFKNIQLKTGYFTLGEYLKSTIPHVIVCLMPNQLRDYVYRNFLRKKAV